MFQTLLTLQKIFNYHKVLQLKTTQASVCSFLILQFPRQTIWGDFIHLVFALPTPEHQ